VVDTGSEASATNSRWQGKAIPAGSFISPLFIIVMKYLRRDTYKEKEAYLAYSLGG
jgi:hypothetical protein